MEISLPYRLSGLFKQPVSLEQLPAFSRNSGVQYALDIPGLAISIALEPCSRSKNPGPVKEFSLNYDPSRFWRGSLIHRALGLQKLEYTKTDVRRFGCCYLSGTGEMFEVYLRHPEDTARKLPDGPLMFISRESGRILFYPPGTKEVYFSFREYMTRHWEEVRRSLGKQFKGEWTRLVS